MRVFRAKVAALLAATALIAASGCKVAAPDKEGNKAKALLSQYNLHVQKQLSRGTVKLGTGLPYVHYYAASRLIGLDLEKYAGMPARAIAYRLKEKSEARGDKGIEAHVLFDARGELIGAYLTCEWYVPGIFALNDRSNFRPGGR